MSKDGLNRRDAFKLGGLGAGDLDRIEIVGNAALADCARQFRPHDAYHRQRRWKLPNADWYLRRELVET